jgi:hypothetical protein
MIECRIIEENRGAIRIAISAVPAAILVPDQDKIIVLRNARCIQPNVAIAGKTPKCPLFQLRENPYSAKIVSKSIKNLAIK